MPTDSNESPTSTTTVVPSMSALTTNTTTTVTTSVSNNNKSSSSSPPQPQSNSPLQSPTKQLNKLKRFLSTLYHFGSDISNEIAERVRALILALVNNALSVEEFHGKVQAATNFPLRPFALPFLKSTLPFLQKDLSQLARQSKQSTSQFIAQHEELILLPRDILETSNSPSISNSKEQNNEHGKRKLTDNLHELDERSYATKRSSANLNNNNNHHHPHRPFVSSTMNNNMITSTRRDFRDKERTFTAYLREYGPDLKEISDKNMEDNWKTTENMLNCILEMVSKTKRVLFVLQQKDNHLRRLIESNDFEWRRRHAELLTQTEDRILEVRRKAEEAVIEIKRQSISDLQKAVSQTEQKSNEILHREREQYQRLKAQTFEEAYALLNRQDDGPEQCWHCGRKAIETCSGCNIARYCGQYCQHRDWESHQKLCGPDFKRKFNDNPQLSRYSLSKTNINISSNLPVNITRRNSSNTPTTPYLHVSSLPIVGITTLASTDDDKSVTADEELTMVENDNA